MNMPAATITALLLVFAHSLPAIAEAPGAIDGGYSIDTSQRAAVSLFYKTVFRSSDAVDSDWNGDIGSCDAGDTRAAYKSAVLRRINWFRAMAGVPADVELDPALNAKAQQAALLMAANGSLSHSPPPGWACFGLDAHEAAGRSNLSLGRAGPEAVTFGYMEDPGATNAAVGHRRWLLYPQTGRMGTGDVQGDMRSNALWVIVPPFDSPRPEVRDGFVAWPPPGHVPFDVVFPRWSLSYPKADFTEASVSMTRDGVPVPVQLEAVRDGFGENTLVWFADGYQDLERWERPAADTEYGVVVENVTVGGKPRSFSYSVTVFDPDQDVATPAVITALGRQEEADKPVFQASETEGALQYQWRNAMLSPFELHDTADEGLENFAVSHNAGYQPHVGADEQGNSYFRLAHPGGRDRTIAEALELREELLPGPAAKLQFRSRMGLSTTEQIAAVEISADGGLSWQPVHEQIGESRHEFSFSEKSVSLAQWQGRTVRLRFRYIKDCDTGCRYFPYSGQGGHWEIDDIRLSGVEAVTEPINSAPLPGWQVAFSPVRSGRQLLQSRAGMYGQFSHWSRAHMLTVAASDLPSGAGPDVVLQLPSGPVEPLPGDDDRPAHFNGVTPPARLGLPLNNAGYFDPVDGLIHSCLAIETQQQPDTLDGTSRFDVALEILSLDAGTVRVTDLRPFNAGGYTTVSGEPPDCSGTYETSTGVYEDIVEFESQWFRVKFLLLNAETLELRLIGSVLL